MTDQDQAPQPYTECPECGERGSLRAVRTEDQVHYPDGSIGDPEGDWWLDCGECGTNTREKIVPTFCIGRHAATVRAIWAACYGEPTQ